ncbi:aldolase/citrate lyase family protein [Tropicibacter naphthalenivorans]|uniref:Hydroxypyruvate/pyruvate aldolase n=1 Tax=Tropicibacter naphthalenivorans TaxID=441103 RepID=A0A0P1GJT8_9RHOB|nr:HpcH/HpaI aldolase/citrate lyase family protein [Tropicibacter naphthalenivorans]CUH82256.1 4-hydroxy-2-oxo-heptane-1,7-dioate aldolase [Tropicibacter naphthalenivorans]SMD04714.1 2,4-dihydroxyhept-2-enedioate aldolase [Tropicibacter naphthalenivorans]
MPAPTNTFKARLKAKETQIGLWVGLGDPSVAELAAGTGFDWLVIDAEHGPNGLRDVLGQLRAVGSQSHPVVRPRDDNRAEIKQMLDIGAQTLLVPMIESGDQAREVVRSVSYPPVGVRGVGAALARASSYNGIADYLQTANEQVCLLLQVESRAGLEALDDILNVEGVDGVFIGPADLAADMGFLGQPGAPEVQAAVNDALTRIRAAGKAAGILTSDRALAKGYAEMGVEFLAVGSDVGVLRAGLTALRAAF